MGSASEMFLEGDLCECCGSFIDMEGGSGFPRYCSPQCARDRGATYPKRKTTQTLDSVFARDPFIRERRWLQAASQPGGVALAKAPTYLQKLMKRGFLRFDPLIDENGDAFFFITDQGRAELKRIAP